MVTWPFLDSWPRSGQERERRSLKKVSRGLSFQGNHKVIIRPSEDQPFFVLIRAICCHLLLWQMLKQVPKWLLRGEDNGLRKTVGVAASWAPSGFLSCSLPFLSKTHPWPQISSRLRKASFWGEGYAGNCLPRSSEGQDVFAQSLSGSSPVRIRDRSPWRALRQRDGRREPIILPKENEQ